MGSIPSSFTSALTRPNVAGGPFPWRGLPRHGTPIQSPLGALKKTRPWASSAPSVTEAPPCTPSQLAGSPTGASCDGYETRKSGNVESSKSMEITRTKRPVLKYCFSSSP